MFDIGKEALSEDFLRHLRELFHDYDFNYFTFISAPNPPHFSIPCVRDPHSAGIPS